MSETSFWREHARKNTLNLKKSGFVKKACLYLFMLPWQRHIRQLNHQKIKVCVVNLLAAIFDDRGIKGFREKGQ